MASACCWGWWGNACWSPFEPWVLEWPAASWPAFDATWMVKWWVEGIGPLEVLAECESLYQLLSQISPENMHHNVAHYGLHPATPYPNLNFQAMSPSQI